MKRGLNIFVIAILTGTLALQGTLAQSQEAGIKSSEGIRPFQVHIPNVDLKDLRKRIQATRLPDKETVADQSQGVQLTTMQKLVRYWATAYDWRKAEAKLNVLPQFMTTIDGA